MVNRAFSLGLPYKNELVFPIIILSFIHKLHASEVEEREDGKIKEKVCEGKGDDGDK